MFLIEIFSIIWVIVFLLILYIMDWNFSYFFSQSKLFNWWRERYSITLLNGLIGCWLLFLTFIVVLILCISIYFSLSTLQIVVSLLSLQEVLCVYLIISNVSYLLGNHLLYGLIVVLLLFFLFESYFFYFAFYFFFFLLNFWP